MFIIWLTQKYIVLQGHISVRVIQRITLAMTQLKKKKLTFKNTTGDTYVAEEIEITEHLITVLSSCMTYHHQVCNYINTMDTASWAGTVYPSETHEFTPVYGVVRVTRSLVLWSFLFWPLCCLSFDLLILIASLWYHQTLLILVALVLDLVIFLFFNRFVCTLLFSWCPNLPFFINLSVLYFIL